MTATQYPTPGPLSKEIDARAKELFQARWPGKSWDGCDVSRSYWRRKARESLAPTAPVEASGSEREELDSAASAFIATSFGFSGPNDQDTPLQAAAREVGWMLSEVVDRIEWNKRGQAANALGRLATSIDGLVWPWEGDDPRHDQIRDAWRSYADNSADDDGRIDLTEVETCVAIGCMKAMQLLSSALRPQPSGETRGGYDRNDVRYGLQLIADEECDEVAASYYAKKALALLSARPLALGGQQGVTADSLTQSVTDETMRALLSCKDVGTGRAHLAAIINALSTTPARAEAQDEGAAGLVARLRSPQVHVRLDAAREAAAVLAAHPSPTPAADLYDASRITDQSERAAANLTVLVRKGGLIGEVLNMLLAKVRAPAADAGRVREAIADVISHESDWRTALMAMDAAEETPEDGSGKPGYWLHQIKVLDRIAAALKSTAAKEGGAL